MPVAPRERRKARAANKELNALVLRGDAEGYTDLDAVDDILECL